MNRHYTFRPTKNSDLLHSRDRYIFFIYTVYFFFDICSINLSFNIWITYILHSARRSRYLHISYCCLL